MRVPFPYLISCYASGLLLGVCLALPVPAGAAPETLAISAAQIQSLGIRLERPRRLDQAAGTRLSAQVVPAPEAEWVVTAPAAGVLVRLPVAEGEAVAAGAVLAELRSPEVPQLAAELAQAESAARLARADSDRDQQLHREGIIAARRAQASEQAAVQAESRLAAIRMRLRLQGLSAAEAGQGRVLARAPVAATVVERLARPGQRLAEADPLLRLIDPRRLMLELQWPVAEPVPVPGERLRLPDGREASVLQVGWAASSSTQTLPVRAALPAAAGDLRPGQWLSVQRLLGGQGPAWSLPASAVSRHAGGAVLFLRETQGFRVLPVTVLAQDGERLSLRAALSADSQVAVSGTVALKGAWQGHGGGE